jgi:hypothetical protein
MITKVLLMTLVIACIGIAGEPDARHFEASANAAARHHPHQANADELTILQNAVDKEERWIKVHAAEALLAVDRRGSRAAVSHVFERELDSHGSEPQYRIGIWRVLAQAASSSRERDRWERRIADAFLDARAPDRLHAAETLGKLRYRLRPDELEAFERAASAAADALGADALWVLANNERADAERRLAALLRAPDAATRSTAAYAVRHLAKLGPATWEALSAAAGGESADDLARASLAAAAFVHAPAGRKASWAAILAEYTRVGTADTKSEALGAYSMAGDRVDAPAVRALLDDGNADTRVAAARALLEIARRPLTAR